MMAPVERLARGRTRVRVEDVDIRRLDDYLTIGELLDMLEYHTGRRWHSNTALWWIAEGWLPAMKAGDGKRAAWLVRRDHARAFAEMMRQRACGEVLGIHAAAAWLGERLRGPGETVSHNTIRSWAYRGLLYPVNPDKGILRFTTGELEDFAVWFEQVKVWRWGRWSVPIRAQRRLWDGMDAEAD